MLFKRIKYRIGFILFATLVFSLGGVLAHTYWTLKQRFLDYSAQNIEAAIKPLEEDVVSTFKSEGTLDAYRNNPERWERSTRSVLRNFHRPLHEDQHPPLGGDAFPSRPGPEFKPRPGPEPEFKPRPGPEPGPEFKPRPGAELKPRPEFKPRPEPRPDFKPEPRLKSGPRSEPEAKPEAKPESEPGSGSKKNTWQDTLYKNQLTFVDNLALYDANSIKVIGSNDPLQNFIQYPVTLNGSTIAIIAYKTPNFFVRSSEFLFLDQQLRSFGLIGAIGLMLALLVASLVSKSISIPLSALAKTAKRIANGDFTARIHNIANDEIGDICEDFNAMAEKLEAHELSRKRWVADISHEMRTPLAVLKAQVEAIEDGVRPANKENLALLSLKINSINHLINDLYELSLFDIGAMRCNKESIDIELLVQDFIDDHIEQLESDNFAIEFTSSTSQPKHAYTISADRERIIQLLNNILQNTKRYTDKPGKIHWSLQQDEQTITLTLEDSSPSIEASKIDKIFERLYRTDESRSRERGGAGLGLSICKGIVEIHEGTIGAQTSSLGGIAIIVRFPRT